MPAASHRPEVSIITLQCDGHEYTRQCVNSIRRGTTLPYELIIVDNGSEPQAATYATEAADLVVLNERNLGFAAGMNSGIGLARAPYIAFVNNDTILPEGWDSKLIESLTSDPNFAIAVPAVTNAGSPLTVRSATQDSLTVLPLFKATPSGVLFLTHTSIIRDLGGWDDRYPYGSYEDVDLCFQVWANDLDIVFDERVLVAHTSKGTALSKLGDYESRWETNQRLFLDKWIYRQGAHLVRLPSCSHDRFERNVATAQAVAYWMHRYVLLRDRLLKRRARRLLRRVSPRFLRWINLKLTAPISGLTSHLTA